MGFCEDSDRKKEEEVRSTLDCYTSNVRVVDWSDFSVGVEQSEFGQFSLDHDFSLDDSFGSVPSISGTTGLQTSVTFPKTADGISETSPIMFPDNTDVINEGSCFHSSEHSESLVGTDGLQNWENSYPGWKYDFSTEQWYQVGTFDSNTGAQSESSEKKVGGEKSHDEISDVSVESRIGGDDEVISGQKSDVSYLNQSAESVVRTVTESLTNSMNAKLNSGSQEISECPPNMVFDPQYPGWYYDTNYQQWKSLESYSQSIQVTANVGRNQSVPAMNGASLGSNISERKNNSWYDNGGNLYPKQNSAEHTSEEFYGLQGGKMTNNTLYQPNIDDKGFSINAFSGNHQSGNSFVSSGIRENHVEPQKSFTPAESTYTGFIQTKVEQNHQTAIPGNHYGNHNPTSYLQHPLWSEMASNPQFSQAPRKERSSAGRPPHGLVTFGFGGKLVIMKQTGARLESQNDDRGKITMCNLMDVIGKSSDVSSTGFQSYKYFHTVCNQAFPGPLVGGNASSKDLNKWIDDRISSCKPSLMDTKNVESLRSLLSLLKISYKHYGKLRSPFGSDSSLLECNSPEDEVTMLFGGATKKSNHLEYCSFTDCIGSFPSEEKIQATSVEVQNLLVSGKRKEALHCAQKGLLWGPALVLSSQLGEKFYVDTVRQMAHHQFIFGSPLRTLFLLIAGQPADVFTTNNLSTNISSGVNASGQAVGSFSNAILDGWEENLAVITANRTKDDEFVIVHLGDCLWKEKCEVISAHTCYLLAEANMEPYSDSARLCLIGADHWQYPRTYASPDAIQRTEFYEYSKVLGNSQFVLLSFQPYKLIYAYMLAEVGKVADSLRYCQAITKTLKNLNRAPEVENLKTLVSSLVERLRTHQQGGYGPNLDTTKLVGKFFNTIDRSISSIMGSPPQSMSRISSSKECDSFSAPPKVASSRSTRDISSLVPSPSLEKISEWAGGSIKGLRNRCSSEPNFGRASNKMISSDEERKESSTGRSSMFRNFGSQLFEKTVEWVSRSNSGHQAKLGEQNKFYFDEKLKRWVEEGSTDPPHTISPSSPPTTSFQNSSPDYNINSAFKTQSTSVIGGFEQELSTSSMDHHSPGIPPIPPTQNQFSSRGRGVRSRYVDTFNTRGRAGATSAPIYSLPNTVKHADPTKFFTPVSEKSTLEPDACITENGSSTIQSPRLNSLQRYQSIDNFTPMIGGISKAGSLENIHGGGGGDGGSSFQTLARATACDGGFFDPKGSSPSSLLHEVEL